MAFYGNITAASKTSFQFDKVYSNRYDMDLKASSDGVFVGRFVLVDYDTDQDKNSYEIDTGNTQIYLREAPKLDENGLPTENSILTMYGQELQFVTDAYKNKLYIAPVPNTELSFKKEVDSGRILLIPKEHIVTNTNTERLYFQVTDIKPTDTPGVNEVHVKPASIAQYNKYWQQVADENQLSEGAVYQIVYLDNTTYEPFTFFIYDEKNGAYVICEDEEFNKDKTYYDIKILDNQSFGVVSRDGTQRGIYYGSGAVRKNGYYCVLPGCFYHINTKSEYYGITGWTENYIKVKNPDYNTETEVPEYIYKPTEVPIWEKVAVETEIEDEQGKPGVNADINEDYIINMAIDRSFYGVTRGYDSTVWQKVYQNGKDRYVMVAELNSVVPTFDIEADAPTAVPLTPHFDPDSNNVYYKIHMQPAWSFRTKFADPGLLVPRIDKNGAILNGTGVSSRINGVRYPSDQKTTWESDFYNKYTDEKSHKYYNVKTQQWDDEKSTDDSNNIPAAVYFNKKGFNPEEVSYSDDLLDKTKPSFSLEIAESGWKNGDKIDSTPTGHSGQLYDNHGYGTQTLPAADTQEFSVMLPSIGDSMAKVWDIIFGGRETNDVIAQNHKRNMDHFWEDARKGVDRRGLRMVGDRIFNGYNKAEVDTLAGCINSVHDLMGMIISKVSPEKLLDLKKDLNEDYIYYVGKGESSTRPENEELLEIYDKQGKFLYKHHGYEYTPVDSSVFDFVEIQPDEDNFDYSLYYVKNPDGTYRPATDKDKGPFYAKNLEEIETFKPESGMVPFDGTKYYYNDGCSVPYKNETERLKMSDWVRDKKYQANRDYYTIGSDILEQVDVSQEFAPNRFYYKDESTGDFLLSSEKEADPKKIYYIIQDGHNGTVNRLVNIQDKGYDNVYSPGVYFYRDAEGNYAIDTDNDGMWDQNQDGQDERVGHYYAIRKPGSDKPIITQEISYEPVPSKDLDKDNFDPSSYYIQTAPGEYAPLPPDAVYEPGTRYYYKVIKLITKPAEEVYEVGKYVMLTPYQKGTFYKQVIDQTTGNVLKYEHLTANVIRDIVSNQTGDAIYAFGVIEDEEGTASNNIFDVSKIDTADPTKYALQRQNVFYVPGLYHYKNESGNYGDYILDIYPTMWHMGQYYTFKKPPTKTQKKFYEPDKYWTNKDGEWILIKGELTESELNGEYKDNIFSKETFYVYEDTSGTFHKGMEWNPNVTNIPPTVTLAKRKEKIELRELEGFARDENTIHGILMRMNRLFLQDDEMTRDDNTVQGVINALKDKIAQFGRQRPNEVMVVDNYGRTQSAETHTLQDKTAHLIKNTDVADSENTGILADTYKQAANIEAMRDQWITLNVDANVKNPKLTIHHNFQSVKNTPSTFNMNGNGDTMEFYIPLVDKMGHVVGHKNKTVTFPFGFKHFTTNGSSTSTSQLTTGTTKVSANNTQDTFQIYTGNKWLRMVTDDATNRLTIAHEIHTPNTQAIANITDLDDSQTFIIQDMQFDAAGHIIANQSHTYKLPDGVKFFTIGGASTAVTNGKSAAGTIEADNQVATFKLNPQNRWITMEADPATDTITIGHAFAGSDTGRLYGDASAQTPKFGATFKVPYFGVDEAGHVKTQSAHTVKIPLPSLVDTTQGDVLIDLKLVAADGKFTLTRKNVGTLRIQDYSIGTSNEQLSNSDTINSAFGKLQTQINEDVQARKDLNFKDDYVEGDGKYVASVSQSAGLIKDIRVDLPSYEDSTVKEDDGRYVHAVTQNKGKVAHIRKELPSFADATIKENDGRYVHAVTQERGKIVPVRKDLPSFTDETIKEGDGMFVQSVSQEKGKVTAIRAKLPSFADESIAEDDNMYVHSITQENGLIIPIRKAFNFIAPETEFEYNIPEEIIPPEQEAAKTIEWLFAKVAELEKRISDLENPA